jgi:hypothetical protein
MAAAAVVPDMEIGPVRRSSVLAMCIWLPALLISSMQVGQTRVELAN